MLRVGICQFLRALSALAASYMAGKWAVGYTFQERGYDAIGSEYMFALAIYLIVFKVSGFLFVKKKKRRFSAAAVKKIPAISLYGIIRAKTVELRINRVTVHMPAESGSLSKRRQAVEEGGKFLEKYKIEAGA